MSDGDPFFVGWAHPPRAMRGFLAACAIGIVALFGGVAYLASATAEDPGDGAFRFDWGAQTVTGWLEAAPYPVLHVTRSDRFPAGHAVLLSGVGKTGVQGRAAALTDGPAQATGVVLKRGDLDMLQVGGGADAFVAAGEDVGAAAPETAPLGRWRVTGEICDGKCYAGAMRPGTGLAHRACANLCLIGGAPPVLVTTAPVDGARFLLLGGADGGPLPREVLDHTALLVEIEGEVERRGDLRVLLVDPADIWLAR